MIKRFALCVQAQPAVLLAGERDGMLAALAVALFLLFSPGEPPGAPVS